MNRWELKDAVLASSLSPTARLVMLVLVLRADTDTGRIPPEHTPSLTQLARDTGLSRATVVTTVAELDRLGWALKSSPDKADQMRGARNEYWLCAPPPGPTTRPPRGPTTGPPPSPTTGLPDSDSGPTTRPPLDRSLDQPGPTTDLRVVQPLDTDLFISSPSSSSSGAALDAPPDRAREDALRTIASKAHPAWWPCPDCGARADARCRGQREGAYHRRRHDQAYWERDAAERALQRGGPLAVHCFTCGARPGFACRGVTDHPDPSRNAPPVKSGAFHDMRVMEADVHPLVHYNQENR